MIRKYQSEDTDAVVSIWQSAISLAHPFLDDDFVAQEAINLRTLYLPNAETWVVEDNETPVGFIALIGNEIGGLFLDPSFHGQGLGRGFTLISGTLSKRPIMAMEERHAKKKKILGGVQT